jgi:DNA polymerase-3 subunit beta
MKFTANTREIAEAIGSVAKIIKSHSTIAMLQNVLIVAEPDGIVHIRATDLETTIERTVDATVTEAGSTTVGGKLLASWLAAVKNETIALEIVGNELELRSGKANVAFPVMDAAQYPPLPTENDGVSIRLDARSLRAAVLATSFAASQEEARGAILMGTLIKSGEDGTTLVCTDGYRLALQKDATGQEVESKSVIPTSALVEAARNVGDADLVEVTLLGANRNQMRLTAGRTTVYVRLVDGAYPAYEAVVPKAPTHFVTVRTVDLQDALKRTALVSGDRASMIVLAVQADGLRITAASDTSGRADESVDAKIEGEPLEIGLNGRYFSDILGHIGSPETVIELSGPLAAVIVRPAEDTGTSEQKYILMPLRR